MLLYYLLLSQLHTHRHQMTAKTDVLRYRKAYGVGCLCNLLPHYEQSKVKRAKSNIRANWQHGIALITIDTRTQRNYIENLLFEDYTCMWGGKLFSA